MLGLVAFVMLSPQAQEAVFGEFGGVDEFLQSQLAPYHIYPNEASYTLSKTYEHTKEFGSGQGTENILIPPTYMSSLSGQDQFVVQGEDEPYEPTVLQQTLQITVAIDGTTYIDQDVPQLTSFPAYVGFTAATGGATNYHLIDALEVEEFICD